MGLITSFIPHPQPLCLDLAAAFPCACWLIRGWRLGVQRAQVSSFDLFWGLQSICPQMARVLPNLLQPQLYIQKWQRTSVLLPPKGFMHMLVQHLSCYLALYRHYGYLAGGHHRISCWRWFGTGRCQRKPHPEGMHMSACENQRHCVGQVPLGTQTPQAIRWKCSLLENAFCSPEILPTHKDSLLP